MIGISQHRDGWRLVEFYIKSPHAVTLSKYVDYRTTYETKEEATEAAKVIAAERGLRVKEPGK
jgi:hypothetical protein